MKSKVTKINDKQTTVRTILPKSVQEILNLKAGDYVEWTPKISDGKIIFEVQKGEVDD